MNKFENALLTVFVILLLVVVIFFVATPAGRGAWNSWFHQVQKVDDDTNYKTLKKVEDTARAMISSYNSDKLTYEQYKNSDSSEKQGWGEQAKMRANKTASTYNNYLLQNSYMWEGNIPSDIRFELSYLE